MHFLTRPARHQDACIAEPGRRRVPARLIASDGLARAEGLDCKPPRLTRVACCLKVSNRSKLKKGADNFSPAARIVRDEAQGLSKRLEQQAPN